MIPPLLDTQKEDATYLSSHPHGALFSEPGTGKTLTALEGARIVGFGTAEAPRMLILAPPIALRMWRNTTQAYFPTARVFWLQKGRQDIPEHAEAVVCSYSLLSQTKVISKLADFGATIVICDESDYLKGRNSKRSLAVWGVRGSARGTVREAATYVWPLTGTPIRRYPDDLYPQLKALHPALMKKEGISSYEKFCERFCYTELRRYHPRQSPTLTVVGAKDMDGLADLLFENNLAVRRSIADVAPHLPKITERIIDVSYKDNPELREATGSVDMIDLESGESQEGVLARARRLLGVAKAPDVWDYCLDVQEKIDKPLLVLYWHKEVGNMLEGFAEAADKKFRRIDGSTPQVQRHCTEDMFNAGGLDFLFGQIQSMGVSLNLQAGSHYVVAAEFDWSEAAMDQAKRRLWRMGQEDHVMMDYCLADHPVDDAAMRVLAKKKSISQKVMG